jgi:uncharacterized protein (TIGR03437 family)
VYIYANGGGLSPGTYNGEVELRINETARILPVTLTVPGRNLKITNSGGVPISSLAFSGQGSASAAQQVSISDASGATNVTASYRTSDRWLLVNKSQTGQFVTPAKIDVTVDASGLPSGVYNGTVTITPSGGSPVTLGVALTVKAPSVSAAPARISVTYMAGGALPESQIIPITGAGDAASFTASAASDSNWLVVSPQSGTIPASGTLPLTVSFANLTELAPNQTYNGTIVVAGTGNTTGITTIPVSLSITTPAPTIQAVTNAASYEKRDVSAGEIVTLFGTALGPKSGVLLTSDLMDGDRVPTTLGGVQVEIDGIAAPMLYAGENQISCIVPYEVSAPVYVPNLRFQVKYLGRGSNSLVIAQAPSSPGILTADSSGSGQGAILNSDFSSNGADHPANQGDIVVLYLTGEGPVLPRGVTGRITPAEMPLPQPILAPQVTIDGQAAEVVYYGAAPGMVAGVLQINVRIPASAASGALPVVVKMGSAMSQLIASGAGAVTVAVH